MSKELNPQDKAVADYLTAIGVTFTAALVGATERDGWECDEWRVKLVKRAESGGKTAELATTYYTGTGHRASKTPMPKSVKINPRSLHAEQWTLQNVRPVAPTAASVLHNLLLDAGSAESNFPDWCGAFGYDTDSRKALTVYEACCSTRADVNKLFTRDERAALATMLEDY